MNPNTKLKWFASFGIIFLIAIVIAVTRTGNVSNNTIKIGVIAPLTGQYGSLGESFKNAVTMAVGNDKNIQVIFEDSKFDAKTGLAAFQKLTSIDHIDALIVEDSPTLDAITPLVHQMKLPTILIFEAKEHAKDSIFQMIPFSYPLFSDLGELASENYKRIALVYSGATDVFLTDAGYFKKGLASTTILVNDTKTSGTTDFRSEVTKILVSSPDAVINILPLSDSIKFIKELNAQKGKRKISLICDANMEFAMNDYIKALGTSTFEGCLSTNLPNLTTDPFKQAYAAMFHSDPVIGADWGYDAANILKSLVGLPKDQWVDKIQSLSFEGASGRVSFDENGTRVSVSERHIFKNGKFVRLSEE